MQQLGMSQMHLHRKAKAVLGTGVTDCIQVLRLTKAQMLLAEGCTIAAVAYRTRFSSPSYFSTACKGRYQMSPSEYKDLHALTRH
nr:helix-turn-helix transcriptional regulator [Hymenobacter nivis]